MKKISAIFFAATFLAGFAVRAELPDYFFRVLKTEQGLPDNVVTAVVQGRDGYLWLGTYGGLARFDGVHFTIFNSANEPELQSDRVTSLFEDATGALWIGHERGDVTCYHDGKFSAQSIHETGVRRKISSINADSVGDIWIFNEEGTFIRVRDGQTCALPNNDGAVEVARDRKGKLWVCSNGQLASLENGRLNVMPNFGTNNTDGYVQGLGPSRGGGLWVVTDTQVRKWNGEILTDDRGTNPCRSAVAVLLEMKSGCLALGTSDNGLYLLFADGNYLHYDHASGFPSDWIRSLREDREGTLWVGAGSSGLIALRPGKVKTLESPDHWQGRVPLSTTATADGALWISTEGAGVYRFLDDEWKHFGEGAGISNQYVWCVSADARGQLWAGTWGGGMFLEKNGQFITPPGLENVNVPMPAILQTPEVTWIGTASGLIRYENGVVTWFGEKDGLKVPDVRSIADDGHGTIWFGMLGGGLGRLQNGTVKQFFKGDGLSSDYIQCLHMDGDGALWMGSYGSGINRLKNGRFTHISMHEGLLDNFISDIEEDARGNFWISSRNGIFSVAKKNLDDCAEGKIPAVTCLAYGIGEGMPTLQCSGGFQPAATKTADGRIWFPTSKGLVAVDPADAKINLLAPPVVIEEIIVGGHSLAKSLGTNTSLRIPAGRQRVEFRYTGLSFVAPEKMQFRYRLEPWENEWMDDGGKRLADYSYIPPGNYTFKVRAANSDGVWNEDGAAFSFIVLPAVWQTWWFRFATILVAIAAVAGTVLFLTRRRMRRKLETIQRQQAVERERTRIAKDIHDHLGANLTRISLLSQAAHGELENPIRAAKQLERIYDTSRELTRSMDEIVWAVNPQHDTLDSLASYLGNFAQEFLVSLDIRCRLDVPLHLPHWPITAEMRHNVFLAFKEALNNVVKHSGATEVFISLATDAHGFVLVIRDDGKGFDPAAPPERVGRGNGLKNLRQRLEKLGGHCDIQSAPAAGTEIKFSIALPATARRAELN